jgi:hypothetical protein
MEVVAKNLGTGIPSLNSPNDDAPSNHLLVNAHFRLRSQILGSLWDDIVSNYN